MKTEEEEGMSTGEIVGYAALVGFSTFLTTAMTMYAMQRMKE